MSDHYTLAAVQMRCSTDPKENTARALHLTAAAAKAGAQVVCLPELFRTQYFCQTEDHACFDLAEAVPDGPTSKAFAKLAKKLGIVVVASLFERRAPGLYHNTAVTFDADGSVADVYRKMHIPDDPAYYEKFYFTPGDLGFRAVQTKFAKIGVLVCWDQWYPEGARLTALRGAEILFYPTAIGWHPAEKAEFGAAQADAWRTIQRSHAIANGAYVCAVNRIGHEGPKSAGIEFWGGSFVSDPFGVVLAEAGRGEEETLVVRCDRRHQESVRRHWPFFRDRRVDAYEGITSRYLDR
jgi:N-carbamoylputrescine amidase